MGISLPLPLPGPFFNYGVSATQRNLVPDSIVLFEAARTAFGGEALVAAAGDLGFAESGAAHFAGLSGAQRLGHPIRTCSQTLVRSVTMTLPDGHGIVFSALV
jgi:hypothetical protein